MKKIVLGMLLLSGFRAGAADYWEKIPVPVSSHLLSVSFGSALVGYVGGTDSTLIKTTDGGKTWKQQKPAGISFSAASPDILDVRFLSPTLGFAVVGSRKNPEFQGNLYKTTDGGDSWLLMSSTIAVATCYLFDADNGFVAGAGFFSGRNIQQMVAGSWKPVSYHAASPSSFLTTIDFWDKNTGIIGGDAGTVYRTFDGGASWDTVQTNVDSVINGVRYLSKDTILAVTSNTVAAISISTDGGKTWTFDPASMTFYYPSMKAVVRSKKDSLIFVGHSVTTGTGVIYYFGSSFMNIFSASQDLNDVDMANDSIAFIAGDKGLLLSNRHITTSIQERSLSGIGCEVFPNPAGEELHIRSVQTCQARLYDMQGRKVWQSKSAHTEHTIKVSGFPSGTYMVHIMNEGGDAVWTKAVLR